MKWKWNWLESENSYFSFLRLFSVNSGRGMGKRWVVLRTRLTLKWQQLCIGYNPLRVAEGIGSWGLIFSLLVFHKRWQAEVIVFSMINIFQEFIELNHSQVKIILEQEFFKLYWKDMFSFTLRKTYSVWKSALFWAWITVYSVGFKFLIFVVCLYRKLFHNL